MTDDRLKELLRAAMPPLDASGPTHDLWPRVLDRFEERSRWSMFDLGLTAAVAVALLMFPEWLLVLVYYL
jgi:hypothetical protein